MSFPGEFYQMFLSSSSVPFHAGWLRRWLPSRRKVATTTCVTSGPSASPPSSWPSYSHPCLTSTQWGRLATTKGTRALVLLTALPPVVSFQTIFQGADVDVQEQFPASKTKGQKQVVSLTVCGPHGWVPVVFQSHQYVLDGPFVPTPSLSAGRLVSKALWRCLWLKAPVNDPQRRRCCRLVALYSLLLTIHPSLAMNHAYTSVEDWFSSWLRTQTGWY